LSKDESARSIKIIQYEYEFFWLAAIAHILLF
jgi:hypothetical protein